MPSFVLALCHPGAELALKGEAARAGLRPAFQAKGLVTFKHDDELPPTFTFASGLARFQAPQCVRVDGELPRFNGALHTVDVTNADAIHAEGSAPRAGQRVRTLVTHGKTRFTTMHVHEDNERSSFPGNVVPLTQPAHAPSRAWLKLEEAVARFRIPLQERERVLEIGSAPGGATTALLDRGLTVVGIDPNEMDPRVLANTRFQHMRMASTQIDASLIQGAFDWLVVDVNVPPGTALRGALPFAELHASTLKGVVLTLKLGAFEMVEELPSWQHRVQERLPGFTVKIGARFSDQQEMCLVALR